jgi:hypothetical protein
MATPNLARALPDFATLPAWPFPGLGSASGWAERLVVRSLAQPSRAEREARGSLQGTRTPGLTQREDLRPGETPTPSRPGAAIAGLTTAIANIVAVAAQRALAAGELPKLRDAIDHAMEAASGDAEQADPRDACMPDLPRIVDAEPSHEAGRLLSLLRRQIQA